MKTIGEKCKEWREAKGWNSTKMAREVGTSRTSIENMEKKGDYRPRFIAELAHVMGVSIDYLLNDELDSPDQLHQTQINKNQHSTSNRLLNCSMQYRKTLSRPHSMRSCHFSLIT